MTPYDATAARLPELIANVTLIPVEEGPDNIGWTHPDEVNTALLDNHPATRDWNHWRVAESPSRYGVGSWPKVRVNVLESKT